MEEQTLNEDHYRYERWSIYPVYPNKNKLSEFIRTLDLAYTDKCNTLKKLTFSPPSAKQNISANPGREIRLRHFVYHLIPSGS